MPTSINGLPRVDHTTAVAPYTLEDQLGTMTIANGYGSDYTPTELGNGTLNTEGSIGGNFTAGLPQKPLNIKLLTSTGGDLAMSLMRMSSVREFRFLANYDDPTHGFRNAVMLDLLGSLLPYTPQMRWVEVYHNGIYIGLYQMAQRMKRNGVYPSAVIASLSGSAPNQVLPNLTGGYIVNFENAPEEGDYIFQLVNNPGSSGMKTVYPKGEDITQAQKDYISGEFNALAADFANGDLSRIDVPTWAMHHMLLRFCNNSDSYVGSTYFYKERGGKIKAGGLWDFGVAFGFNTGHDWSGIKGPRGNYADLQAFIPALLLVEEFQEALRATFLQIESRLHDSQAYIQNTYDFLKSTGAYARSAALYDFFGTPSTEAFVDMEVAALRRYISDRLIHMRNTFYPRPLSTIYVPV